MDEAVVRNTSVLVAAFEGWNDAANSASDALRFLVRQLDAKVVRELDCEQYYDFQAARPSVEIVDGVVREIRFATTNVYVARRGERDVVLAFGTEPNLRWASFCHEVLAIARTHDIGFVVVLGALLGDTPHTRPVTITGTASDPELAQQLGLSRSRYEGPTGIVGVLADQARQEHLPCASLWASVPHYVAAPPNAAATFALLESLDALLELDLELHGLADAARAWVAHVDDLVGNDSGLARYVQDLDTQLDQPVLDDDDDSDDALDAPLVFEHDWQDWDDDDDDDDWDDDEDDDDVLDEEQLPSGESLAADFERYLREQRDDGEPPV